MGLEIRVLGTTRAFRDGVELDLGGRRPGEVLALLVAAGGEAVPAEVLADRLWRGRPPATAQTTLQGYVARLRRVLEPGRTARTATTLVTRGSGYALDLTDIDVRRFVAAVERARQAVAEGRLDEADALLTEALRSWRGEPYQDVADVLEIEPAAQRLEEVRLSALDELAGARLALGGGPELVPDLTVAAAAHPLRERTQTLLAQVLYRAGRQADALAVLRATRERLADELGLDPSPAVRELEAAMLRQDLHATAPPPSDVDDFVGREAELAALRDAWTAACAGRSAAVVVTGEPGIGKTRLIEAFASRAGVVARWGRCAQAGGAPPYWVWQQILGGRPDAAPDSDAGGRFALGLDIVRRLRAAADQQPLLVVLDDLQWADADSLHVLEIVLAELRTARALLVLICREEATGEPALVKVLALATRVGAGRRLALSGLSAAEVTRLAASVRGQPPDPAAAQALAERSGGNPFFVAELATVDTTPGSPVPAGVRDVLRTRVDALPAAAVEVLGAVAVAGREVALAIIASALDRSSADLDAAVQPAVRSGLLVESTPGRLRTRHDLVREVVLSELGPARRAALHSGLADALEAGAAAATSAAAIAIHRSEAALGAPDRAAAEACRRAAQEALDRAGDAEAEELSARGLSHLPVSEVELAADLHHVRGVALRRLGRLEESAADFTAEAGIGRGLGDPSQVARAALASAGGGIGGYWASFGALTATDVRLLEEAAARADDLPAPLRSGVLAALAVRLASTGGDGLSLAEAAAGAAGDDPAARARAMVARYVARWTPARARERVSLARTMLRESTGHPAYHATALHLLRCALLETLEVDEYAAVSRRFTELASRRGDGDLLLLDLWWQSGLALARGDYTGARRLADEAVTAAPTVSPAAAEVTRTSRQTVEGIIAWHEHRLPEVVPDVVDLTNVDPDWLGVLAQAHAQAGRADAAYQVIERLHGHPGGGVREPVRTILLVDVYLELRDAERAATLLPALRSYGDTMVVLWPGVTILGPASLYCGAVRALLGDPGARADLERAVRVCEAFGLAPFLARARAALSTVGGR